MRTLTHGMTETWRFKGVMDEGKTRLGEFMRELYIKYTPAEEVHEIKLARNTTRPAKASAVIAICMERQASEKIPEIEEIAAVACAVQNMQDRKSTRLNSSHVRISYAVFCLKKKRK